MIAIWRLRFDVVLVLISLLIALIRNMPLANETC